MGRRPPDLIAMTFEIVRPAAERLSSYVAALERGWSPDNVRLDVARREELAAIEDDAGGFLARLDDPEARGGPLRALDGTLEGARDRGLAYVELTTEPDNIASHRVIEKNGGFLAERSVKPALYGAGESLRWRIDLV